jgi:hypothetical protein
MTKLNIFPPFFCFFYCIIIIFLLRLLLLRQRGCSLVVKPQPSKLMMRVRFPSPAPYILDNNAVFRF